MRHEIIRHEVTTGHILQLGKGTDTCTDKIVTTAI